MDRRLAALGAALAALAAGAGVGALRLRAPSPAPPGPAADADEKRLDAMLDILSGRDARPAARRFSQEFRRVPELSGYWEEYQRTGDAEGLARRLEASRAFVELVARFATELSRRPAPAARAGCPGGRGC